MKFAKSFTKVACCTILACSFAAPAAAAITIYTDKAAFLAAVTNPGTDTFNDLSAVGIPSPLNRTAGVHSYVASTSSDVFFPGSLGAGDDFLSNNLAVTSIIFSNFSTGVKAVGGEFFGSNVSGSFTPVRGITLSFNADGATVNQTITNPQATSFLGIVAQSSITSITVLSPTEDTVNGPFSWASANNLILAETAPIPEPASWAMMIAGFGLVGSALRRRRPVTA